VLFTYFVFFPLERFFLLESPFFARSRVAGLLRYFETSLFSPLTVLGSRGISPQLPPPSLPPLPSLSSCGLSFRLFFKTASPEQESFLSTPKDFIPAFLRRRSTQTQRMKFFRRLSCPPTPLLLLVHLSPSGTGNEDDSHRYNIGPPRFSAHYGHLSA